MTTAQLRCFGCNRVFSPRGLSQHISKTSNLRCRNPVAPHVSATIPHTAFSLGTTDRQEDFIGAPEPIGATDTDAFDNPAHGDDEIGARSGGESVTPCLVGQCQSSPDDGLGIQPPDGEFNMATCITALD